MRLVRAAAWSVLLVVGSIAAAGLVLALDHPPTDAGRPELTAADAAVLASRTGALEADLARAADAAGELTDAGRSVLVRLRALDLAGVADALLAGDVAAGELAIAGESVRAAVPGLLDGLDAGRRLPASVRDRVAAILAVPDAATAATAAWAAVGTDVEAATRFLAALRDHDAAVARAAEAGRAADYPRALRELDEAAGALERARLARDAAAADGRDGRAAAAWTGTLGDHDAALRALYAALVASGGVRTDQVAAALVAEQAARAALPAGSEASAAADALGGGEVAGALLRIEAARGTLAAATAAGPGPSGAPGANPSSVGAED